MGCLALPSLFPYPSGTVVALVGSSGSGKSTLAALAVSFLDPDEGRVLVDGVDLARMPAEGWRSRLAGAFQDFFRFELRAQQTVGVGDVPRVDDRPAVESAVRCAKGAPGLPGLAD